MTQDLFQAVRLRVAASQICWMLPLTRKRVEDAPMLQVAAAALVVAGDWYAIDPRLARDGMVLCPLFQGPELLDPREGGGTASVE